MLQKWSIIKENLNCVCGRLQALYGRTVPACTAERKTMKKIKVTAAVIAAAMLLCSCSGDGGQTTTSSVTTTAVTTATTEGTAADTSQPESGTASETQAAATTAADSSENTTVSESNTAEPADTSAENGAQSAMPDISDPAGLVAIESDDLLTADERLEIIKSAQHAQDGTGRVAKALAKAANGEEITVAYIGGSITEGISAGAEGCYARLSYEWLCSQFPNTTINYINAGLSGTPSSLGAVRAERDILDVSTPDIVFVEFAVNDGQNAYNKTMYESLVRRFLELDNETAVVLLFTVLKNGYSCQEHMSAVGEHYSLPMISLPDSLVPAFESGTLEWSNYSDDESHPNVWGHELVAQFIQYYFAGVMASADDSGTAEYTLRSDLLFDGVYSDVHFVDSKSITPVECGEFKENSTRIMQSFPNGWHHRGGGTDPIVFEFEFKDLFLVVNCNNNAGYGAADVYVDGELVSSVSANRESGWGNPEADLVYTSDTAAKHRVEIKPTEDTQKGFFGLLGLGYTE